MRRLFVIATLIGTMFLVDFFKTEHAAGFTLAAIGFVILASFTTADLGSSALKLPKVTGYILAGILLGPYMLNILSSEVVQELKMFNTLALGLIALNAGLELSIEGIKKIWRTLFSTIALKLFFLPILVGGAAYTSARYFPGLLGEQFDQITLICLSMIFATLAIATSPAIAIAVVNEMEAKGRSTDLILGAAIFKDLVVVISLAIVVAITNSLLDPNAVIDITVATVVLKHLGASLGLGICFGVLIIFYVKYLKFQMLLFIFCIILAAAELSLVADAELLLVFITAGFIVRNYSKYEHDVLEPMNLVSLPTFVIFFTIAGAAINLDRTLSIIGFALILVVARAVAYFLANYFASMINQEEPVVKRKLWLGYISQAGVTLGLVGLASGQIPLLSDWIFDIGVAVVAINLLVGPIGLRLSISHESQLNKLTEPDSKSANESKEENLLLQSDVSLPKDEALKSHIAKLHKDLISGFQIQLDQFIDQYWQSIKRSLESVESGTASDFKRIDSIVNWSQIYSSQLIVDRMPFVQEYLGRQEEGLTEIPIELLTDFPVETLQTRAKDKWTLKFKKLLVRCIRLFLSKDKRSQRLIPLRSICRAYMEIPTLDYALILHHNLMNMQIHVFHHFVRMCDLKAESTEILSEIEKIFDYAKLTINQDIETKYHAIFLRLTEELDTYGTPMKSGVDINPSTRTKQKQNLFLQLQKRGDAFSSIYQTCIDQTNLTALKTQVERRLEGLVVGNFINSLHTITEKYLETLRVVSGELETSHHKVKTDVDDSKQNIEQVRSHLLQVVSALKFHDLSKSTKRFTIDTSVHRIHLQFRKIAATASGRFTIFTDESFDDSKSIKDVWSTKSVDYGDLLDEYLVSELAQDLESSFSVYKDHLENLFEVFNHLSELIKHSLDEKKDIQQDKGEFLDTLQAALEIVRENIKVLGELEEDVRKTTMASYEEAKSGIDFQSVTRSFTRSAKHTITGAQEKLDHLIQKYESMALIRGPLELIRLVSDSSKKVIHFPVREKLEKVSSYFSLNSVYRLKLQNFAASLDVKSKLDAASPLYRKGFSLEPLRDRKYLVVNKEKYTSLLESYRNWRKGLSQESQLLVGESGSGKTSFINVFQNELESGSVVRLDPIAGSGRGHLIRKLALDLGCDASIAAIRSTLAKETFVIILDDFEFWFKPTASGLRAIRECLALMDSTKKTTFWVASVSSSFYRFYVKFVGLDNYFNQVLHLSHITKTQIREMIENRLTYCGMKVQQSRIAMPFLKNGLRFGGSDELYFKLLVNVSKGNLYDSIANWIRSTTILGEKQVQPSISQLLESRMNLLQDIPSEALTVLILLARHGPLSERELQDSTSGNKELIRQGLLFLSKTNFVTKVGRQNNTFHIVKSIRHSISHALGGL